MSEQTFDEQHPPTHWHLLLELRVMQKEMGTLNTAITASMETHKSLREDIDALKISTASMETLKSLREDIDALKIRVAQGVIIAVVTAFVLPILITMSNPRIHFQSSPTTSGNEW
jgi:hypothetical protein